MKKVIKIVVILTVLIGITTVTILTYNNKNNIDNILETKEYVYLPKQAKNYIKEVYEKTGKILATELNKKNKLPYLNPRYVEYLSMSDEEKEELKVIPTATIIDYDDSINKIQNATTIPSSFMLTNDNGINYISDVEAQGDLGLCWAFATIGAAETKILKKTKTPYSESAPHLSERQLDYVTATDGIIDYKNEYDLFGDRYLGDGGNFYLSTIAIANGITLTDNKSFKEYDDTDFEPMELSDVLRYDKSLYEVNSTINMPTINLRESTDGLTEEESTIRQNYLNIIKSNIMEHGAAYVGTYMNDRCLYYDTNLQDYVLDVYDCGYSGSHAMQIIGWDDNISYNYCADGNAHVANKVYCQRKVSGKGAWILKNSWGNNIPYLYLTYDSWDSQIHFVTEIESNVYKNWDNNYLLGDFMSEEISEKTYLLSDTRIKNDEKLKKIKFIMNSINSNFTIKIINNNETIKTIESFFVEPGLKTINIDDDVIVNKDSQITITTLDGAYIDEVSFFTTNIDETPYLSLEDYNNKPISDKSIRLYSDTKNIPSGSLIEYKLYDINNNEVSDKITYKYNIIAENNINTYLTFLDTLEAGTYKLEAVYNSYVLDTIDIIYVKMEGLGTEEDPYIITNSTQLDQIRYDLDAYYKLANNIDLTNDTREGGKFYNESKYKILGGHGWIPIEDFSGTLDGDGYAIKGLYQQTYLTAIEDYIQYYSRSNNGHGGLFGKTTGNLEIKNLILEDFDITCHNLCGILMGEYLQLGTDDDININLSNIVVKNSIIKGTRYDKSTSAGGLAARIGSNSKGNFELSNIYIDTKIEEDTLNSYGGLFDNINSFKNTNINNIQIISDNKGKYDDGSGVGGMVESFGSNNTNISNIFSTVYDSKIGGSLINTMWIYNNYDNSSLLVENVNSIKIPNYGLIGRNDEEELTTIKNVNLYDLGINSNELTKKENYSNWLDFEENWIMEPVDGISRYPVLKIVDFEYTNIDDIQIDIRDEEQTNIYDLITPQIDVAKRIIYKIADESIITIDEEGNFTPLKVGETTIKVESLYDGYIKDVPIIVDGPKYTVEFNANGGIGDMSNQLIPIGEEVNLNSNTYTKEGYKFIGWNTKEDGTGISYVDNQIINNLTNNDNEVITLYAMWNPIDYKIEINANGGIGENQKLTLTYDKEETIDKTVFTKEGYNLVEWNTKEDGSGTTYNTDLPIKNLTIEEGKIITLYAIWSPINYQIEFNANGGIGSMPSQKFSYDEEQNLNSNTYTKEGYKFIGWDTKEDGTGTSYIDNQSVNNLTSKDNEVITLYAIWDIEVILINTTTDKEVLYDSKEHSLDIKVNVENYQIQYSIDEINYTNDVLKYKEVGEYTIYYKITADNCEEIKGSNKLKIYGVKQADSTINIKENIIITKNNSFSSLTSKFSIYAPNYINQHFDSSNNIINTDILKTNDSYVIKVGEIGNIKYIISLLGDINSDSKVNSADYVKIKKHIMETEAITNSVYKYAADINSDDKISSKDYVKIKKYIMNGESL